MRISVLGLGYIGLPTSIVLADAGHKVYGFDVNKLVIDSLNQGKVHIKENNLDKAYSKVLTTGNFEAFTELQSAEVYIIAVPTPFKCSENNKYANLDYIDSASKTIAKKIKKNDLVILESTSPPMTTKRVTDIICEQSGLSRDDFYSAHCPERVLPGKILHELRNNDRIIGAEREEAALKAKELYESFVTGGQIYITDDITAEMTKLVENSYRDVNIAFANELSYICNELDIDVYKLIELANKHPRVDILKPGVGVGGHCISVDPWFIIEKFKSAKIIKSARAVNDNKPVWLAKEIDKKLNGNKSKKIGILGLAYKPDIDDLRESPSIILASKLIEMGYSVIACEPNVDVSSVGSIKIYPLEKVMEECDLVLIAQNHKEFADIYNNEFSYKIYHY